MEPPLSELFRVVIIDWTALLFPLATRDAASHTVDVTDRGHTGPVKNGDAFERLCEAQNPKIQALLPTTRTHNQTEPHGNTQRREER